MFEWSYSDPIPNWTGRKKNFSHHYRGNLAWGVDGGEGIDKYVREVTPHYGRICDRSGAGGVKRERGRDPPPFT